MWTSRAWRKSESIGYVRQLPDSVKVYSNGADAIALLADREAEIIPEEWSLATTLKNDRFRQQMETPVDDIARRAAVVVYFKDIRFRGHLPPREKPEAEFGLAPVEQFADATIYGKIAGP